MLIKVVLKANRVHSCDFRALYYKLYISYHGGKFEQYAYFISISIYPVLGFSLQIAKQIFEIILNLQ